MRSLFPKSIPIEGGTSSKPLRYFNCQGFGYRMSEFPTGGNLFS